MNRKEVSTLLSKKIYFYIAVICWHLLLCHKLTYFNDQTSYKETLLIQKPLRLCVCVFFVLIFFWVTKMFKFSAYLDNAMWLKRFKKEHILISHIAVKELLTRACFAWSQYRYWFQSYKPVKLGTVYEQNIPKKNWSKYSKLNKPPWKVISVQNFTGRLLYTWKIAFIK